MRRFICVILLISIIMTIFPVNVLGADNNTATYTQATELVSGMSDILKDVSESDWYYDSVRYVIEQGIFKGTGENTFSPHSPVTRAMYVTIIGRIAGVKPEDYPLDSGFSDVKGGAYYVPYIAWAVEKGITNGVGNNLFAPDAIVNREQMAVLTVRYFESHGIEFDTDSKEFTPPEDISDISNWAQDSVLKLWRTGIFVGDKNGRFNPRSDATRAEAATFGARTSKVVVVWQEAEGKVIPTPTAIPTPTPAAISKPTPNPTPSNDEDITYYTVSFYSNGGTITEPITVKNGTKLTELPIPRKENAIFLAWYKIPSLQGDPVNEESIVTENLSLYAKYLEVLEIDEEEHSESFSLIDQEPGLIFSIGSIDNNMSVIEVKSAISLETANGSQSVELIVSGNSGAFTVRADKGFIEGASYKLNLTDNRLYFIDRDAQIRTCSFTISKDEVFDLRLKDGIIYISDSHITNIIKDNTPVESLSVPLVTLTEEGSGDDSPTTGSFTYNGNLNLEIGNILCIYSGELPEPGDDGAYLNDDIAYITVTGINGNEISYSTTESDQVLFIPDMIPVYVGEGHTLTNYANDGQSGSFTTSLHDLKFEEYSYLGLSANTTLDEGDFLLLSSIDLGEADEVSEDAAAEDELDDSDIVYAKVISVQTYGTNVQVEFVVTTFDEIKSSASYYSQNDVNGEQMLENVDIEEIEAEIIEKISGSDFDSKVATYLTTLAMSTDDFGELADTFGGMESLRITMADGSAASPNEFRMMAADAKKVQIKEKKVNAKLNTKPKNFNQGIHCEIEVNLKIHIQAGDNVIEILLTASFVEEIKLLVNASGSEVWKNKTIKIFGKKIYIPYIDDYRMSADIDLYDYTAISFRAVVSTVGGGNSIDVSQKIQKLLGDSDKKEITNGVKELYELYSDMISNATDWIEIFDQQIVVIPMSLLWGTIQVRVTVNFVAAANINIVIGSNYESMSGTRYCVWAQLEAKQAGSSSVDLMDKTYTFQFYVIGTLGLKVGIKVEVAVGLFSLKLDSIGIEAESGIFTRLFGFFFYQKKLENNKVTSNKSGALYFELGVYLETKFKAQVLNGKYMYNPTLYENEWTLLSAGQRYNVYDFAYSEPESITFNNQIKSYSLPSSTFNMTYLDLREGIQSTKTYSIGDYSIHFSDQRFSITDGKIVANVQSNIKYLECDMTITWKQSPLAFSSIPISRTYRLIWDTLDTSGYTIAFESNGGSAVKAIRKQYGQAVSAPQAPARIGYTFSGWYSDKSLNNPYSFTTMGWENVVLYARWTPNTNTKYKVEHYQQDVTNSSKYTLVETQALAGTTAASVNPPVKSYSGFVSPAAKSAVIAADGSTVVEYKYNRNSYSLTFVPNNGESSIVNTVKFGAAITTPALKKTGYTFAGWNKAVAKTMPNANTTYTALWNPGIYTVLFDSNGGSIPSSITVTYGEKYGTLPTPVRQGYSFVGWYNNESDNIGIGAHITANTIVNITSMQVLYAKWAGSPNIPYTVKHYLQNIDNNGYLQTPEEIGNFTGTAGTEVTPAIKSYEGFKAPQQKTMTISGDGSTTVNYYYTRNSYKLTFKPGNGDEDIVMSLKYGAAITAPEVSKEGYTFDGWNTELVTMPAGNLTVEAKWIDNSTIPYTVNHYQETLYGDTYELIDTENLIGEFNAPTSHDVKSYTGFGTPPVQTVFIELDGSTTVNYYYTRNSYTLTFKPDNGDEDIVMSLKYGAAITAPEVSKEGYIFDGWTSEPATMPAGNLTLEAEWIVDSAIPYTVNHYQETLNGGTYELIETESLIGEFDAPISPAVKSYTGFTAPVVQSVFIAADGSTTVNYYYTRKSYTLTFKLDNGDEDIVMSLKYGSAITAPEVSKEGYIFDGWTSEPATMPAENLTMEAEWIVNSAIPYTVNHYQETLNGGTYELIETESLIGKFDAPISPAVKSYTGFTAPVVQSVFIAADGSTTVNYYYTRKSYTLTFKLDNGDEDIVMSLKYGAAITAPEVSKEGYIFDGWTSEPATMPAGNLTLEAKWIVDSAIPYTVNHYQETLNGGTYELIETESLIGEFDAPISPALKSYTGFTAPVVQTVFIAADGSTTVNYYYTRNSYTLTFKPDNGDEDIVMSLKYGAAITAPEVSKEGYIFDGWTSEPATMPAQNITYTAIWIANNYHITFDSNGGTEYAGYNVTYDLPYNELPVPVRTGYVFEGWYDSEESDNGSGTLITASTTVYTASEHTLYAKWSILEIGGSPEEAMAAVEKAESSQKHVDFADAKSLVTELADPLLKESLQARLDAIVIVYNLSLADGRIVIYPDRLIVKKLNENNIISTTSFINEKFRFVITGIVTADTPLQIFNDTNNPATFDVTLENARIEGSTWASAIRIDYADGVTKNNKDNLIVNFTINGTTVTQGYNHPGLQANGEVTVNLEGTENSMFVSSKSYIYDGQDVVASMILLKIDLDNNILEMRVGGNPTSDITEAYSNGPLEIKFK